MGSNLGTDAIGSSLQLRIPLRFSVIGSGIDHLNGYFTSFVILKTDESDMMVRNSTLVDAHKIVGLQKG